MHLPVFVHWSEKFLKTFLNSVSIWWRFVEGGGVALHGFLLSLVNPINNITINIFYLFQITTIWGHFRNNTSISLAADALPKAASFQRNFPPQEPISKVSLSLRTYTRMISCLNSFLKSLCHLLLEVFSRGWVLSPHVLVSLLQVGPILHHLANYNRLQIILPTDNWRMLSCYF